MTTAVNEEIDKKLTVRGCGGRQHLKNYRMYDLVFGLSVQHKK
jgi:hypothetical protein